MPQQSRYSNDEFETLMNNVILTLEEGGANRDLSLMVLGNVITHILNTQVLLKIAKPWQHSLPMYLRKA